MLNVRPAEITDAPKIVEILRDGFPQEKLPYTIYGCPGIEAFVADCIKHQDAGDGIWCVLCQHDSEALGFAEVRHSLDTLFFNHLFASPSTRGPGVATRLMFHGLTLARNASQSCMECDVFVENVKVRRQHAHLGLKEIYEQTWLELPPHHSAPKAEQPWYAGGLPQAGKIHQSYGFSQFSLHTPSGTYQIGRLGDHVFRATTSAVLADPSALGALATLDPKRSLLCIDKTDSLGDLVPQNATVRARSVRMRGEVDEALRRLARFLES